MQEPRDRRTQIVAVGHHDPELSFDESYFANYWPGLRPYQRDDYWLGFFGGIADRIAKDIAPSSVLDAGCALGILVEALRDVGIEAWGVDISQWAIDHVDESVRDFCWQGSLTEPLPRRYDLITCIEVLEHLPDEGAEAALDNICSVTDRVLFSSTPGDFGEPTHVNIQPIEEWAARFARRGFHRNLDLDASFVAPWAMILERSRQPIPEVVRRYERSLYRLSEETRQVREQLLRQEEWFRRDGTSGTPQEKFQQLEAENQRLHDELLTTRDALIDHEAKLGDAHGRMRRLEAELVRYQDRIKHLDVILRSRSWRIGGALHRLGRRLRRRRS
jgi:SAM-dependent methyltransferase